MGELTIHRAEAGDSERVRELNQVAMADTPEWVEDAPDEDLADLRSHYLDAEGSEFLVGVVDGAVVATGAYIPLDGWMAEQFDVSVSTTAELSRMRVHPDYQGQGIGSAVCDELESRARSEGYGVLVLNTGVDNKLARGFYNSRGFDCVQEWPVEFEDLTLDLALYRKSL